jgi:D-lyxose ketol-isomerase
MSKRQDLIDFVILKMSEITDFENVSDFEMNWQQDELPALSVFDNETTHQLVNDEPEAFGQTNTMTLNLQIFTASSTKIEDVRALVKQVWEKIAANKYWDDLAMWTKPRSTSISVDDRGDGSRSSFEVVGAQIQIEIALYSDAFDF